MTFHTSTDACYRGPHIPQAYVSKPCGLTLRIENVLCEILFQPLLDSLAFSTALHSWRVSQEIRPKICLVSSKLIQPLQGLRPAIGEKLNCLPPNLEPSIRTLFVQFRQIDCLL